MVLAILSGAQHQPPDLGSAQWTQRSATNAATRARLRALTPPDCQRDHPRHLDAAGFFASLANRVLLYASRQSPGQVSRWDHVLVPRSRILDPLLGHRFGRSLMAVCRRAR